VPVLLASSLRGEAVVLCVLMGRFPLSSSCEDSAIAVLKTRSGEMVFEILLLCETSVCSAEKPGVFEALLGSHPHRYLRRVSRRAYQTPQQ
jgi:hypothetical protein